ncbi:hypothetical protein HGO21_03290 [Acinetobacter sp. CUI P1]|nr:hypothetical protein [Acinetobacter sp. CUI P1]
MLRKTIYDSKIELKLHKELETKWGTKVKIHDHVPVRNVVELFSKELSLKRNQREYLLKSDFDYVIATEEGEPYLVIEFDGLGEGFSRNGAYVQLKEYPGDPNRKWKLDLKIWLCEKVNLPLVVISYPEVEKLVDDYTILDGIVGNILADKAFDKAFDKDLEKLLKRIQNIEDAEERQSIIDNYGIEKETRAQIENNPVIAEGIKLEYELKKEGVIKTPFGTRRHVKNGNELVVEYYVTLNNGKETNISETIVFREIKCNVISLGDLGADIAKLLLLKKLSNMPRIN